jgi:hypothetical protein
MCVSGHLFLINVKSFWNTQIFIFIRKYFSILHVTGAEYQKEKKERLFEPKSASEHSAVCQFVIVRSQNGNCFSGTTRRGLQTRPRWLLLYVSQSVYPIPCVGVGHMMNVLPAPFGSKIPRCSCTVSLAMSQMAPYALHSALLLTRALWALVVLYVGNRVPFHTQSVCLSVCLSVSPSTVAPANQSGLFTHNMSG